MVLDLDRQGIFFGSKVKFPGSEHMATMLYMDEKVLEERNQQDRNTCLISVVWHASIVC